MKKILFSILFLPLFASAITPVFTCGFECGVQGTIGQHWQFGFTNIPTFSTSTVRSGARSMRSTLAAASDCYAQGPAITQTIVVERFYFNIASNPTADVILGGVNVNGGVAYVGVGYKNSDGKIYAAKIPGFTTGATGVSISAGWHLADVRVNISSNPWIIEVSIDGSAAGTLNVALASNTITNYELGISGTVTEDIYYDDFIASHTSGDYPIGAGYVNHFVPTSDGTHSGLTTSDFGRTLTGTDILNSTTDSYLLLDDVPLESGASVDWINMLAPVTSTYVENVFGPAPGISTPTAAPRIASIIIGIHAAGTGAYNGEWLLNDNGTTSAIFTASAVAGVTTVIYKTLNLADPPSAASAWTLSGNGNFNNIRVRFGPTSSVDANPDVYFDCAMIEAEFETVAAATPVRHMLPMMGVGMINLKPNKQTR